MQNIERRRAVALLASASVFLPRLAAAGREDWEGHYTGSATKINRDATERGETVGKTDPELPLFMINIELVEKVSAISPAQENWKKGIRSLVSNGYTSGREMFAIRIPQDYSTIGYTITARVLRFKPSNDFPYDFELRKAAGPFGGEIIKGYIKTYRITPSGDASLWDSYPEIAVAKKSDKPNLGW